MALLERKGSTPKNAVLLSRTEALDYQWKQINSWPNKLEIWPFRWGISTLSALAGASGWYINSCYRKKLKLRKFGGISTTLPLILSSSIFSFVGHVQFVTYDLFLNETKCPVCLQQRASVVQIVAGVAYPMIMSPSINCLFALYHSTIKLPYWKDYKGTLSLWWKITKPLGKSLLVVTCAQVIAANYLTYEEAEKLYKLKMTLMKSKKVTEIEKASKAVEH